MLGLDLHPAESSCARDSSPRPAFTLGPIHNYIDHNLGTYSKTQKYFSIYISATCMCVNAAKTVGCPSLCRRLHTGQGGESRTPCSPSEADIPGKHIQIDSLKEQYLTSIPQDKRALGRHPC